MSCGCCHCSPCCCVPPQQCIPENWGLTFPSLVGPVGPPGGPGTFVENYDALRAINASAFTQGYIAWVSGYATTNDGGGGNFAYDAGATDADNDGTIIQPTNGVGRWFRVFNGPLQAKWFGAVFDDATDDAPALQAALDVAAVIGGFVELPEGVGRLESEVTVANNVGMFGQGGKGNPANLTAPGATVLKGAHTGTSILNLVGSSGCKLSDFGLIGDSVATPKLGLLLGRNVTLGSAGDHTFSDFLVSGYFSIACVMSVASENNTWISPLIILAGGGGKVAFFTGQSPDLGIANPTVYGGTNIAVTYLGLDILNYVDDGSAKGFFLDGGSNTKAHTFYGCYSAMKNGVHVYLRSGVVSATSVSGPILFIGWSGERLSASSVDAGFRMNSGGGAYTISGLVIEGCKMDTDGGPFIDQETSFFLTDSRVQVPANTTNSGSVINAGQTNTTYDFGGVVVPIRYGHEIITGKQAIGKTTAATTAMQEITAVAGTPGRQVSLPSGMTGAADTIFYNAVLAWYTLHQADANQASLAERNLGNDTKGSQFIVARNSSAGAVGPAAGCLVLMGASGQLYYLWVDATGDLRINTVGPTGSSGAPTVSDTAGTVVGTQA